jgi:hypothetical protein
MGRHALQRIVPSGQDSLQKLGESSLNLVGNPAVISSSHRISLVSPRPWFARDLEDSRLTRHFFRGLCAALSVSAFTASTALGSGACPPDIDNDTHVDVDDLIALVTDWGSCSGWCPSDISPDGGNGEVNVDDLLEVVTGWGPCGSGGCDAQDGCLQATSLWCENFELNNYDRWTGGYDEPTSCESNGFVSEHPHGGTRTHRSDVLCSSSESHRGYGGLRFEGDTVLQNYTYSSGGIDAPHGVVVTLWSWIDCPYTFDSTRWVSLITATHDCSNSWNQVVTLNIDDPSMRLKPVHVSSVTYAPGAPAFPRGQWNRITMYLNYYTGSMHVWQNGTKVCSATFSRPTPTMCQWHFGLYASGPNNDITLFEDDYSIVKLDEPLVNFSVEPQFPGTPSPCGIAGP